MPADGARPAALFLLIAPSAFAPVGRNGGFRFARHLRRLIIVLYTLTFGPDIDHIPAAHRRATRQKIRNGYYYHGVDSITW